MKLMEGLVLILTASCSTYALANDTQNYANTDQFVRYLYQDKISYGKLTKSAIFPINGDIFSEYSVDNTSIPLESVELLLPTEPEKVFAVGMNYMSHAASHPDLPPPMFLKLPSSLILSGEKFMRLLMPKMCILKVNWWSSLAKKLVKQVKNKQKMRFSA